MLWISGGSISKTSNTELPTDDLRHLEEAFNALGKHRFGAQWRTDMAGHMRLGPKSDELSQHDVEMGRWAISALVQCVQNGWLPLVYFRGDRRIWYYSSSDEPSLFALYPRPTDEGDGQIELEGGKIYPCMVDLRDFPKLLQTKFSAESGVKRGPERGFTDLDDALRRYFEQNPTSKKNHDVHRELRVQNPKLRWPEKTVRNERINEARHQEIMKLASADLTPANTPDGVR